MANPEKDIVCKLAASISQRLSTQVIRSLQRMNACLLSGDDSGLTSTWDEICVQVQYQKTLAWDTYLATIESLAHSFVEGLKQYELEAVWLVTPEGDEWWYKDQREPFAAYPDHVVSYVVDCVLSKSGDWSNARIQRFMDRSC